MLIIKIKEPEKCLQIAVPYDIIHSVRSTDGPLGREMSFHERLRGKEE